MYGCYYLGFPQSSRTLVTYYDFFFFQDNDIFQKEIYRELCAFQTHRVRRLVCRSDQWHVELQVRAEGGVYIRYFSVLNLSSDTG